MMNRSDRSGHSAADGGRVQTAEARRLADDQARLAHWRRWGPYLSERQWGTVREDYSASGSAWDYFPHDHARSRVYRWGEDGIAGLSDNHQRICFALAFWNGRDPILKERLFGVSGTEGNHGEDVKECYWYLDNTPTHSSMAYLYKYPQRAFPYAELVAENRRRDRSAPEYELLETGVFDDDRYWDVFVRYAKAAPEEILIEIRVINRGPDQATLHVLPTLWFRNLWSWGTAVTKPGLTALQGSGRARVIEAWEPTLGTRRLVCEGRPDLLFTENETNTERLFGVPNAVRYTKDGINDCVVEGRVDAVNPARVGTKAAAHYRLETPPRSERTIRLCLTPKPGDDVFGERFQTVMAERAREADSFYRQVAPDALPEELRRVQRQAFAGLLWNKQYYHYVVEDWLSGDPVGPVPPHQRRHGRNRDWTHLYTDDILSMPDKWEYPWFAAWDLAFHVIPLAVIDPEFAKRQLVLLTREWYMHPNGQIPAYEWSFEDVNPPVHAWAAWRVYKIDKKRSGRADIFFLERVFQKLLLNFTWWVNRKDAAGKNIFQGGFLGLDNVSVFDRSTGLPTGGHIEQSDATSWMAFYCLNLLAIALELAKSNPSYEDIASKFFEHFLYIAAAMNGMGGTGLWDEEDGFYHDVLHLPEGRPFPLKLRSTVGLIPLFAVETLEPDTMAALPDFTRRLEWFIANRPDLARNVASMDQPGVGRRRLLSIVDPSKLRRILARMLDEQEFLSPYGVRSLSHSYGNRPYVFNVNGHERLVRYEPAESVSGLFGGNSNWRGPVWFPVNFLIVESLQKFHHYFGETFTVECPTGSGQRRTLDEVATEVSRRLTGIFIRDSSGRRPADGESWRRHSDPHWRDYVGFSEYFHGDHGAGLGARCQAGWTALVAKLIQHMGKTGASRALDDAA